MADSKEQPWRRTEGSPANEDNNNPNTYETQPTISNNSQERASLSIPLQSQNASASEGQAALQEDIEKILQSRAESLPAGEGLQGACRFFCPQLEALQRLAAGDTAKFEWLKPEILNLARELAVHCPLKDYPSYLPVKKHLRSAAGEAAPHADDIRDVHTLSACCRYLLEIPLTRESVLFLDNRLRAIRSDLAVQTPTPAHRLVLQSIVRWYMLAIDLLFSSTSVDVHVLVAEAARTLSALSSLPECQAGMTDEFQGFQILCAMDGEQQAWAPGGGPFTAECQRVARLFQEDRFLEFLSWEMPVLARGVRDFWAMRAKKKAVAALQCSLREAVPLKVLDRLFGCATQRLFTECLYEFKDQSGVTCVDFVPGRGMLGDDRTCCVPAISSFSQAALLSFGPITFAAYLTVIQTSLMSLAKDIEGRLNMRTAVFRTYLKMLAERARCHFVLAKGVYLTVIRHIIFNLISGDVVMSMLARACPWNYIPVHLLLDTNDTEYFQAAPLSFVHHRKALGAFYDIPDFAFRLHTRNWPAIYKNGRRNIVLQLTKDSVMLLQPWHAHACSFARGHSLSTIDSKSICDSEYSVVCAIDLKAFHRDPQLAKAIKDPQVPVFAADIEEGSIQSVFEKKSLLAQALRHPFDGLPAIVFVPLSTYIAIRLWDAFPIKTISGVQELIS